MKNNVINIREIRGLDIFKRYTIKEKDGFWFVPSTSGKGIKYKVDLGKQLCDCPDYEIRRLKCKHLFAAESAFEKEILESLSSDDAPLDLTLFSKRKTYSQDWTAYNKSQTCEKGEFQKKVRRLAGVKKLLIWAFSISRDLKFRVM